MSKSPSSEADVAGRHDEDRFRAFLESVPDAVVVIGGDGRIGHVNARTTALFGFARDELVGAALDVIVPGGFERPPAPKTFAIAGADSRSTGSGLELRGRRKDGSDVPIEVSVAPSRPTPASSSSPRSATSATAAAPTSSASASRRSSTRRETRSSA